jgi:AAA+ ATPase superfamily predicted ATPase
MKHARLNTNPFVFGKVVTGKDFINRIQERREVAIEIENSMNIILYAPRRYGKTSLIMQVFNDLKKKHRKFCGLVVDFYQVNSREKFLSLLANEYALKSGYSFEKIVKTLKNTISGITPGITFDEAGNPKVEINLKPTETQRSAEEILQLPKKLADSGHLVSVFFDEFQEANSLNGNSFQKELRSIIQHHDNVSYIFSGSKFHMINNIFNDANSPLYNIGKSIKLDLIKREDYLRVISNRFKKINPHVTIDMIKDIYQAAGGIPYYIQMLSHEIYNLILLNRQYDPDKMIEVAINNTINNKSDEFLVIYENLSSSAKKVLHIILHYDGKKIFRNEILTEYQIPVPTIQKALKALLKKAIITRRDGVYHYQDNFFKKWMIKNL